ncbi:MAG: outer membrane beta-barrel protein [Pseudomonadota bacterium]
MRPNLSPLTLALAASTALMAATFASSAQAEMSISLYGGANFSPHSTVDYDFNNGTSGSDTVAWDGESFAYPPYWGARISYWFDEMPAVGLALDFTHAKVKADPLPADFKKLEFTDGINYLTLNAMYRHDMDNGWTPYVGIGAGLAIPHVEVTDIAETTRTLDYQVTGLAAQAMVGVDYAITDNWSAFAEYKMTYGEVDAELDGGGTLNTEVISNQVLFGITYKLF